MVAEDVVDCVLDALVMVLQGKEADDVERVRTVLVVVLVVKAAEVVVGHNHGVPLLVLVGQLGAMAGCLVPQRAGHVVELLVIVAAEENKSVPDLVPGGRANVGHVVSSGKRRSVCGQSPTAKTAAKMKSYPHDANEILHIT